ncbi:GntR family transcriptional regulator [Microbacterium oryzae]|uniref:GntR family transcriptional regulator n=1 Tax=Microbacterium oryzae TaxID=743009 RepID=UPI0025B159F1|nr:GntR family transcriptional regulator [Microbacterium oryzae]MDN3310767.1 GntR family transcriptional regulator [Microbacterium oryzae]
MSGFAPLHAPTPARLSELVFERMAAAIIAGELAPGTQIKDEEIASRLGVSRMPVREALLHLERIGLIEMVASRYTRVTEVSRELMRDAFEYAGNQAGWAGRLAMERMTDAELTETLTLLDALLAEDLDLAEQRRRLDSFYLHLIAQSRSRHLQLATRDINLALARAMHAADDVTESRVAEIREAYRRLRPAVEKRDADAVERIIREIHAIYASL